MNAATASPPAARAESGGCQFDGARQAIQPRDNLSETRGVLLVDAGSAVWSRST
jgi:hypothetical protein